MKNFKWILLIAVFTGILLVVQAGIPQHTYKQIMISEQSYKIGYFYKGKFQKYVSTTKPAFLEYGKTNQVVVVPYVAPRAPTLAQMKARKIAKIKAIKRDEFLKAQWEASNEYTAYQALKVSVENASIKEKIEAIK